MQAMQDISALIHYLAGIVGSGDYLNQWWDQIPPSIQDAALELGKWLAQVIWG